MGEIHELFVLALSLVLQFDCGEKKKGLLEKGSFEKSPFSGDSREY